MSMFNWNNTRLLLGADSTPEKEIICQQMIKFGYDEAIKHASPVLGWKVSANYAEEIEHAIMRRAMSGTYDEKMLRIAINHACHIADYGWNAYIRDLGKPESAGDANEFFYDQTFDDYDEKIVEVKDIFASDDLDWDDDDWDAALDDDGNDDDVVDEINNNNR